MAINGLSPQETIEKYFKVQLLKYFPQKKESSSESSPKRNLSLLSKIDLAGLLEFAKPSPPAPSSPMPEEVEVFLLDQAIIDFDGDGLQQEAVGTALLRIQDRYSKFLYLLSKDGKVRFIHPSGMAFFNPSREGALLPVTCPPKTVCTELARKGFALQQLPSLHLQVGNFHRAQGLEILVNGIQLNIFQLLQGVHQSLKGDLI